jgi:aconitate decarboxylase
MALTAEIGRFLAEAKRRRPPEAAVAIVRNSFIDCLAVMIAGWDEPAARIVRGALPLLRNEEGGSPLAAVTGAPSDLALAYATAAHALDYDDTALAGHPSAVLVPAILAEASTGGVDGTAMIAAYIAGYEVWAELVGRDSDPHHQKGWHPSGIFGPPAAAAASAALRGFNADEARNAVAIAASMSGGVVGNFGSMTKPFQLARAAQSGLVATRLAEAGLTAAPDALEHEAGFLRAISPNGRVDCAAPSRLGADWRILRYGLNFKLYPVCYAMHRSLNAMEDLRAAHRFAGSDIAAIEVELGETQAAILRNHRPVTPLEAKFSIEFGVAAVAVSGRLGLAQLKEDFIDRADIRAIIERVRVEPIAEQDPDEPQHSPYDRVRVTLRDGATHSSPRVAYASGHFRRPVTVDRLWRKFEECTAPSLGSASARALFDRVSRLEEAESLAMLIGGAGHGT